MLIDHGADVNAVEGVERETALHTVIRSPVLNNSDTVSIIKLLLKNGANVNVENKYHQSPLGIAYNDEGMSETWIISAQFFNFIMYPINFFVVKELLESKGAQRVVSLLPSRYSI